MMSPEIKNIFHFGGLKLSTLKELRISTGTKPGDLAKLAKISRSSYYSAENRGRDSISPEYLVRIAKALSQLLGREIAPSEIEDLKKD